MYAYYCYGLDYHEINVNITDIITVINCGKLGIDLWNSYPRKERRP